MDPFKEIAWAIAKRRERHEREVLESPAFKDALAYLHGIADDFIAAQTSIRFQGHRYQAGDHYLLFRFAPLFSESVLAITANAKEGMQNPARRELRFMLEAAVKLSVRDEAIDSKTFEERLAGLKDRSKRFEDYVAELAYFPAFEKPAEANAEMLSLYAELSGFVHASVPQFEHALLRSRRDEGPGFETVATLNRFNKLAFRVYDLVLVRLFHSIGLSMAGDIFTVALDDQQRWRFHKGKFTARLSRCFDYKHERQERLAKATAKAEDQDNGQR